MVNQPDTLVLETSIYGVDESHLLWSHDGDLRAHQRQAGDAGIAKVTIWGTEETQAHLSAAPELLLVRKDKATHYPPYRLPPSDLQVGKMWPGASHI